MDKLQQLPDELLEMILEAVLVDAWDWSWESDRGEVLTVCKRFHRLGRRYLYRNVILSTLDGFHCFFLVDIEDWETANSDCIGICTTGEKNLDFKQWRDCPESLKRRYQDWQCVCRSTARWSSYNLLKR